MTEGENENLDAENQETGAEDATAEQEQDKFINQKAVNEAINKQHQKFQDEARKAAGLQTELEETKAKLAEFERTSKPTIPDIPDTFDPEYHEKIAIRDKAITDAAAWDVKQATKTATAEAQKKAANDAANATVAEKAQKFRENAIKMGLDAAELQKAEQVVTSYNVSPQVAGHILGQENGPLIVKYLSENLLVLNELTTLSPIDAAVKISTTIAAEAAKLKTGVTNAPDPLDIVAGKGASEGDSEYLKGVKFE